MARLPHKQPYFLRDVIIATLFTYGIILLMSLIFFNTHYLDPISNALRDFEFTDFYYSNLPKDKANVNKDVVLVNIGEYERSDIARQIEIIGSYKPIVIGVDIIFSALHGNASDTILKQALIGSSVPIVLASYYEYNKDSMIGAHQYFEQGQSQAFTNFLAKNNTTIRYFKPFITLDNGEEYASFAAKIAQEYNPTAYDKLKGRDKDSETINYSQQRFITIEASEIVLGNSDLEFLEGKVVLLGYLGPKVGVKVLEDLYLSPLNKSYGGHAVPDKYGMEIHAQIIAMILDNKYIHEPPTWIVWLLSFLIALAHMYFFLYYFVKTHVWFHLIAKTIQLMSFAAIFTLALLLFALFRVKFEPALIMLAVILSVDALVFLDGIIKWLNKKMGTESYFLHHPTH